MTGQTNPQKGLGAGDEGRRTEGPYQLPAEWVWTTVSEAAELLRGVSYAKSDSGEFPQDGLLPILRATNIQEDKLVIDADLVYVPSRYIRDEQLLKPGDIVICMSSGSKHLVGKTAQLNHPWLGSFGTFCSAVRAHQEIDNRYLGYYFSSPSYREFIRDKSSGININNLRHSDIAELQVPVAPLFEQRRIVAKIEELFSSLNPGVASLKRIQAALKRYRAAVLKAACEGRLVPQDPNDEPAEKLLERILAERRARWEADLRAKGKDPKKSKYEAPKGAETEGLPELPEGWCWARAEQICDFITKGTTPRADKLYPHAGEVPFIKVYNLTSRGVLDFSLNPTFISVTTHKRELARSIVYPGDVLMNIVGPPLGKVSITPETYSEWNINQAIAVFRPMPSYDRRYLAFCLLSEDILSWAIRRAKATAGQFNLTLEICRDLPLPVPPESEQYRIVAEIERRLSVAHALEQAVAANMARAERLRQAILRRAFEGKLVAQDERDEPADALLATINDGGVDAPRG